MLLESNSMFPEAFLVEHRLGRLIVTRMGALQSPRAVGKIQLAVARALDKVGNKAVICSDWRAIEIFAPQIADAVLDMLHVTNPRVLRGGILLNGEKATFNLQVERVLRDADNPGRKCFRDKARLRDWLSDVLEPDEAQQVDRFLAA